MEDLNLIEIKSQLEEIRMELMDRMQVSVTAVGGTQPINPDRADLAQNYSANDRAIALQDKAENTLEKIKHALQRIRDGTYGECVQCGRRVGGERLKALPYVELCIECQRTEEQRSG